MKPVLASILIFLGCQIGQAQLPQYHAQVFGAEQGLDAGGFSLVFKDRQQFLWVVSYEIVQRFDGRKTAGRIIDDLGHRRLAQEGDEPLADPDTAIGPRQRMIPHPEQLLDRGGAAFRQPRMR